MTCTAPRGQRAAMHVGRRGLTFACWAAQESLIQLRRAMLEAEPRHVFSEGEVKEYEKVAVTGVYLHEKTIFVGPRPRRCG